MKEYIDQEGLRAMLIAMDVAACIETNGAQESGRGNEIIGLTKEITFLAQKYDCSPDEEKTNAVSALSDKIKYFAQRCSEIASSCEGGDTSHSWQAWQKIWQMSKIMNEGSQGN